MDAQTNPITQTALENEAFLRVISQLHAQPDGAPLPDFSARNLASLTGRNPSNIARSLGRMQDAGLISRAGEPDLTAEGRQALQALDRARDPQLAVGGVSTGLHAQFEPNPDNPRKAFPQAPLEQLADTIEEKGVLQPIVVWPADGRGIRTIFAGERRWRAAGIVNDRHGDPNRVRIPFVERIPTEEERANQRAEAAELALIENGQRDDLSSYERAVAMREIVPARYPSARQAAKATGVHEKTAQDWLKALADLPADIIARWKAGDLGWSEVRAIMRPSAPAEADPAQIDIEDVTGRPSVAEAAHQSERQPFIDALRDLTEKFRQTPAGVEPKDAASDRQDHPTPASELARTDAAPLSPLDRLALIEATHKAATRNVASVGRAAQVGSYWLDARCSRLKDLGLLTFAQGGGELGWCVMWGANGYAWFKTHMPEVFSAEGDLAIDDEAVFTARKAAGVAEDRDLPLYNTPWLNAGIVAQESVEQAADEPLPVEGPQNDDAHTFDPAARDVLEEVVANIERPEGFSDLLALAGIKLPLRVATGQVLGLVLDAEGREVFTVDQHGDLPNALVAARALLMVAAVHAWADGHELSGDPEPTFDPDQMTPARMRKSIYPGHLVCLEDGRRFTALTRHLRVSHGLSWDDYLTRWKLPRDYPSVAPARAQAEHDAARAVMKAVLK